MGDIGCLAMLVHSFKVDCVLTGYGRLLSKPLHIAPIIKNAISRIQTHLCQSAGWTILDISQITRQLLLRLALVLGTVLEESKSRGEFEEL